MPVVTERPSDAQAHRCAKYSLERAPTYAQRFTPPTPTHWRCMFARQQNWRLRRDCFGGGFEGQQNPERDLAKWYVGHCQYHGVGEG